MSWPDDLLALAKWAIQSEDLRHRFLYADLPEQLCETPGIANTLETNIVLTIYEAAIAKGYKRDKTVAYERAYPGKIGVNPKRSDLAFKEAGRGKNWGYVEVKNYKPSAVLRDIKKLKEIEQRSQRWILCYRVKPLEGKSQTLKKLLGKNFSHDLEYHGRESVPTITENGVDGECEIILARVK